MKMLTITTTKRFVKAKVTSQSIIEEHSALDDHAIAGRQSAPDDHLVALLKTDFHGMGFEAPGCDLDEHLIYVVLQYQCGRWHDRKHLLWGEKGKKVTLANMPGLNRVSGFWRLMRTLVRRV